MIIKGMSGRPRRLKKGTRLPWLCLLLSMTILEGCVNIYTRLPWTENKIIYCYQSTDTAATATIVTAFPQTLNPVNNKGLEWYNIFTIPLFGIPWFVDTLCEVAIDTVLWPIDYYLIENRKK